MDRGPPRRRRAELHRRIFRSDHLFRPRIHPDPRGRLCLQRFLRQLAVGRRCPRNLRRLCGGLPGGDRLLFAGPVPLPGRICRPLDGKIQGLRGPRQRPEGQGVADHGLAPAEPDRSLQRSQLHRRCHGDPVLALRRCLPRDAPRDRAVRLFGGLGREPGGNRWRKRKRKRRRRRRRPEQDAEDHVHCRGGRLWGSSGGTDVLLRQARTQQGPGCRQRYRRSQRKQRQPCCQQHRTCVQQRQQQQQQQQLRQHQRNSRSNRFLEKFLFPFRIISARQGSGGRQHRHHRRQRKQRQHGC
mmetsp:Transcript_6958/g.14148  ORF Transcript_6958/g.14148 Transcript_6958/m.14148 type:complete len:298 (-) Transcript_6958:104-997(-)